MIVSETRELFSVCSFKVVVLCWECPCHMQDGCLMPLSIEALVTMRYWRQSNNNRWYDVTLEHGVDLDEVKTSTSRKFVISLLLLSIL